MRRLRCLIPLFSVSCDAAASSWTPSDLLMHSVSLRSALPCSAPHKRAWNLQTCRSWSQHSACLNCSLLCAENKLDVIILPLRSGALAKIKEMCLCWAQSSELIDPSRPRSNGERRGCQIRRWADIRIRPHYELKQMEFNSAGCHFTYNHVLNRQLSFWCKAARGKHE